MGMRRPVTGPPAWRWRRALLGAALVLALMPPVPAVAAVLDEPRDAGGQTTAPSATDPGGARMPSAVDAGEARALAAAARSGEPVEVLSRRTETAQVFANPDGGFTEHSYAVPQWVRKDGALVGIDTTLSADAAGRLSPVATEVGVSFSGGGDGPLATVVRDGRALSLSWPAPLPKPVIDGDTAVYREVLPGVDLKMQARSGGFGQVLVVKNAGAAADPRLRELRFGMKAEGLEVRADEHGNLRALNPAGQEVFTSGTPLMWDSAEPAQARLLAAPARAGVRSSDFEPGLAAKRSAAQVRLSGDALTLVPDRDLLIGPGTRYPVYIDPDVSGSRHSWTIAYKKYPSTSFFNGANFNGGTNEARVGYENQTNGTGRSFFRMNTKNLRDTDRVISSSTFRIRNIWSWSCDDRPVELWYTGAINSGTTWDNQPEWRSELDVVDDSKGYNSSCPAGNLAFDTTAGAKTSQANGFNTLTLGLRAANEGDEYGWKKFDARTAVLSTTYNTRPSAPTGLDTSPVSTVDDDCGSAAPYGVIGNTEFFLQAKGHDADGGTVQVTFNLWATGKKDAGLILNKTISVTSGSVARTRIRVSDLEPYISRSSGNFSWAARTGDGKLSSAWAPSYSCRFVFDPTRPTSPPGISSTRFPDGADGWPIDTGSVRQQGSFTLTSGGVGDVTSYDYWTSWDSQVRTAKVSAGASATVTLAPMQAGPNMMYARSRDRAGNLSDTQVYLFYANGLSTPDAPGDINGDGNSDIWAINAEGVLTRHYGTGDGRVVEADTTASDWNWTGAQITHRGDWTYDGVEDLISLRPEPGGTTHRLWVHPNSGWGFACSTCEHLQRMELTVYDEANDHWSDGVRQILAIGDVDGGLDTDGDGQLDVHPYPDLLVNDGEFLWLYFGNGDNRLDSYRDPVLLAGPDDPLATDASTLAELTMAAPGDYDGDGVTDLVVRYDRDDNGDIYVFRGHVSEGGYSVDVTDRRKFGYGFHASRIPMLTAAASPAVPHRVAVWVLDTAGLLRHAQFNYATSSGGVEPASVAFAGYQALS
ncbi:hypothetical protein AB0J35_40505 [Nonomuraea angiospora]|uniref:hypothetical protein n=1 Tax=Nonomuraea angiospora TaxID=46172 RepID=UPI00341A3FE8